MLWESSLNDYFRTLSDSSSYALRDWNIRSFFKSKKCDYIIKNELEGPLIEGIKQFQSKGKIEDVNLGKHKFGSLLQLYE